MERSEIHQRLADDLERVFHGHLGQEQFRATWESQDAASEIAGVLANVEHYLADADVRFRDREFGNMQEAEMWKLIVMLRAGETLERLNSIHFLGVQRVRDARYSKQPRLRVSTRRLFKHQDPQWASYVEGIAHPELREVRTIDSALNEYVGDRGDLFCEIEEVDRVMSALPIPRVGLEYYLLAFRCEGTPAPQELPPFEFLGYDLCDETMTSSLLNCGSWDGALRAIAERMNRYGLLSWDDAQLARKVLPQEWGKGEAHAWVDVWGLYGKDT